MHKPVFWPQKRWNVLIKQGSFRISYGVILNAIFDGILPRLGREQFETYYMFSLTVFFSFRRILVHLPTSKLIHIRPRMYVNFHFVVCCCLGYLCLSSKKKTNLKLCYILVLSLFYVRLCINFYYFRAI